MNSRMPVKTTSVAFEIIEAIVELEEARFTELVDHMEMPKSTLHDHLRTMESMGLLVKTEKRYAVSSRFLEIGAQVRRQKPIYQAGRSEVEELATETGEHASLCIRERGHAVLLYVHRGSDAVTLDAYPGRSIPLHACAPGKAMLAHLPGHRIDEIIDEGELEAFTPQTITDPERLRDGLEEIRQRGYAIETNELVSGVRSVAAPIMYHGTVVGAVTVGGPTSRMDSEQITEEVTDLLLSTTNIIELNITYS